jgi:hypothetical protein
MKQSDMRIKTVAGEDPDAQTSAIFRRARRRSGWPASKIGVMAGGSSTTERYLTSRQARIRPELRLALLHRPGFPELLRANPLDHPLSRRDS